jgi:hypothetical protein
LAATGFRRYLCFICLAAIALATAAAHLRLKELVCISSYRVISLKTINFPNKTGPIGHDFRLVSYFPPYTQ